jgi:acyl carrier protein
MGLDSVELVLAVEEHFGIEIPNHEAAKLLTVGRLQYWVVTELQRRGRASVNPELVFAELRDLICHQIGISPELVEPNARFVEDLRID